jgi:TrmH family RNA methyltransferase
VISLAKLASLPPKTRLRKILRSLQAAELELERGETFHTEYWLALAGLLAEDPAADATTRRAAAALQATLPGLAPAVRRALNRTRHALLASLHAEPAEWDLLTPGGELDASTRTVLPLAVYLEEVRSPFNVGSIFRTAEAFGVERILLAEGTASPRHPRAVKTSRGAVALLPWEYVERDWLRGRPGIVALELGGTPLSSFRFPETGVLLVGSEELGLSPECLELAEAGAGRVSIPMAGAKRSLNVAVAVGIVLQAWHERLRAGEANGAPG